MNTSICSHLARFLPVFALCAAVTAIAADPPPAGYADDAAYAAQVKALDASELVTTKSLGKTLGGRDLWLLTIGSGEVDKKPAILVVGGVDAAHLAGSELALRVASQLAAGDAATKKVLDQVTFYVIPRADPDGLSKNFAKPFTTPQGNARPTDDDRDGKSGEDPGEDLNGDGLLTDLRVEDDTGPYMVHPDDPRVLIRVDPKKNERGRYRLLSEGRDNDNDEKWNEDSAGGVSFNRNWTFRYPAFGEHAGANAVSEIETRAIADFAFDHPNIAVVFSFSPDDNLFHPWKPKEDAGRIKQTLLSADGDYNEFVAAKYRKAHGGADCPGPGELDGTFPAWAYFHFGRWSLSARAWWIPKVADEPADKKPSDARGGDDLNALRWLAKEKIEGFVPWTTVNHPDFPGKKAEVGGFRPLLRLNPPADKLESLAESHRKFLVDLVSLLPKLELGDLKVESLGAGVFRVSATAINGGYLPTMPEMGRVNDRQYPLQIALDLPKDAKFLQGSPRSRVSILSGNGGKAEKVWLVRFAGSAPVNAKIRLWAPAAGAVEIEVDIKGK